jgi:propane monooxygenase reductase component
VLSMTGPYGSSTLKDGHVLPVVCVAGGAGMAPILSILRHLRETGSTRPVRFYYGARTAADLFYLDVISELGADLAGFEFIACLSESMEGADSTAEQGNVTEVVERREAELHRSEVYLCGPPPMVDAALTLLEASNVPNDQVFYDKFTSPATDGA